MEEILAVSEKYSNYTLIVPENVQKGRTIDAYQKVALSYILSPYFLWVVLILIMNGKNWKRLIMILLIVHWIFRSTGDLLNKTMDISPGFNAQNMYTGCAVANIFWCIGEIIGDWYPLLRTKAIVNNKKKVRIVYFTCIIYNLTKVGSIIFYFLEMPILLYSSDPNVWNEYNLRWWSIVASMQSASFLYDLSVIICLKQNLFNQLKYYRSSIKNTFVERFKRISEFRILISMAVTVIFLPVILIFIFFLFRSFKIKEYTVLDTDAIENIRRIIANINYTLSYIDQILLKCYVDHRNKTEYKTNFNSGSSSKTKTSDNKTYRELQNPTYTFNKVLFKTSSNFDSFPRGSSLENVSRSNSNTYFDDLSRMNSVSENIYRSNSNTNKEPVSRMINTNDYEKPSMMNNNNRPINDKKITEFNNNFIDNELLLPINTNTDVFREYDNEYQNDSIIYPKIHSNRHPSDFKIYDYYLY
ncbi:hypothetical protein PIROE2DRAFT_1423 [Piromyces sp. E2]|nr:hypothetical protein PIROE2DRAFT_1423 [Piromyces sp. E2]|eukprot:OUM70538.1 hypothetical protein PIROE2DRAFT_1423 [Piromyces sp. E2]